MAGAAKDRWVGNITLSILSLGFILMKTLLDRTSFCSLFHFVVIRELDRFPLQMTPTHITHNVK